MLYFFALVLLSLSLWIGNSAISLFLGISLALVYKVPDDFFTKKYGSKILQTGIVFLGGSLSLGTVYETNSDFFLCSCSFWSCNFSRKDPRSFRKTFFSLGFWNCCLWRYCHRFRSTNN